MNNKLRSKLRRALSLLVETERIVSTVASTEDDSIANYPESFQGTDRAQRLEESADSLHDAEDCIAQAVEHIQNAMERS